MRHNEIEALVFMYASIAQREEQCARLQAQGFNIPEQQGQLFYIEGERVWTKIAIRPFGAKTKLSFDPIAELQKGCLNDFLKPLHPADTSRSSLLKQEEEEE